MPLKFLIAYSPFADTEIVTVSSLHCSCPNGTYALDNKRFGAAVGLV